jgi:drug/metabolite transporter (DMT)-like permease
MITGGAIFFGFAFQTWGLVYTAASKSAFITGLNVVLVPFLLWGIGHQMIKAKRWAAALLAVLGLFLLTNPLGAAGINLGDLLTLGCAVAFAGHIIFLGIYAPILHTLRYFWVQLVTVVVMAGLATLIVGGVSIQPSGTLWLGLGVTGLLGTALAFLGMTWAQRRTSPTRTALILTSEPVFGALFAVTYGGELLTTTAWMGGALIVAVIIWSELGKRATAQSRIPASTKS